MDVTKKAEVSGHAGHIAVSRRVGGRLVCAADLDPWTQGGSKVGFDEPDIRERRVMAGSSQREVLTRRSKPAIRRYAKARIPSPPGSTASGRVESTRGSDSPPETCHS